MLDVDRLLAPVSALMPAGADLRQSGEKAGLYYALKEKRLTARARERQADVEADRGSTLPEWRELALGAQELLATETKDIELASWLLEALLRIDGFAGLQEGLVVLDGLIERFWPDLHSIEGDTIADKLAPLAGLNGIDAEGALVQPLRLAPLALPAGGEPAGLWLWQEQRRRGSDSKEAKLLAQAVQNTTRATFVGLSRDLERSWTAFRRLDARLDALCGADAPPLTIIRTVLEEARDALRQMSGVEPSPDVPLPDAVAETTASEKAAVEVSIRPPSRPLETRDDALAELLRIAEFFRIREPHSPISYAIETLVRRARLPLSDLLRELIPDEGVRRSALNMAGIATEGIS